MPGSFFKCLKGFAHWSMSCCSLSWPATLHSVNIYNCRQQSGLCSTVADLGVSSVPEFLFVFPNRCINIYFRKKWLTESLFDTAHALLCYAEWLKALWSSWFSSMGNILQTHNENRSKLHLLTIASPNLVKSGLE